MKHDPTRSHPHPPPPAWRHDNGRRKAAKERAARAEIERLGNAAANRLPEPADGPSASVQGDFDGQRQEDNGEHGLLR